MAYIGNSPSIGAFKKLDDISSSFNDSDVEFTLQSDGENISIGAPETLLISIDGVIQEPQSSFTVSGSKITFTTAPNTGSTFFGVQLGSIGQVGIPGDATVTTAKLAANAVTFAKVALNAIDTGQLLDDAVTNSKILDGAVSGDKLDTDAVTTTKILNSAVTSAKINNHAVTSAKLDNTIAITGFMTGVFADNVIAIGNTGTHPNIDCSLGTVFSATLTDDATFTFSNAVSSGKATAISLVLTNDATPSRSITLAGGTFKYPLGELTRTSSESNTDIWFFSTIDGGSNWFVNIPMKNLSTGTIS